MTQKSFILLLLIASALPALAQSPRDLSRRVDLIGSFPQSDLKASTSDAGIGLSAGWTFWQMSPSCRLGAFLEHRTYSAPSGRVNLSDIGMDLFTSIKGGFYNRLAVGGERVGFPGTPATIKLVGEFGLGYRFKAPLGVEVYESHLAASSPSATTLNVAVSWYF